MTKQELSSAIQKRGSFLCVGLDTDLNRIPEALLDFQDPIFEFNRRIIDATKNHCVAYKPNLAFYESQGEKGWIALKRTLEYIPDTHFTIADAKRGDIGNTARLYAKTFFEHLNFDAITVAPYMGRDSIDPFLEYQNKWVILLALTSNSGSKDFQFFENAEGITLHQKVMQSAQKWASSEQLMFVVGATQAENLKAVRASAPDHFFLVPGVGAQGGDLQAVYKHGANSDVGLLVNSSRGIIYAGEHQADPFALVASTARELRDQMHNLMAG